jgi:hypothetical protein
VGPGTLLPRTVVQPPRQGENTHTGGFTSLQQQPLQQLTPHQASDLRPLAAHTATPTTATLPCTANHTACATWPAAWHWTTHHPPGTTAARHKSICRRGLCKQGTHLGAHLATHNILLKQPAGHHTQHKPHTSCTGPMARLAKAFSEEAVALRSDHTRHTTHPPQHMAQPVGNTAPAGLWYFSTACVYFSTVVTAAPAALERACAHCSNSTRGFKQQTCCLAMAKQGWGAPAPPLHPSWPLSPPLQRVIWVQRPHGTPCLHHTDVLPDILAPSSPAGIGWRFHRMHGPHIGLC